MTNESMNLVRTVLLVLTVLVLGLTAYLYFQTGKFNFGSFGVALGCLLIFLTTRRVS
jgi:hypothetical protein